MTTLAPLKLLVDHQTSSVTPPAFTGKEIPTYEPFLPLRSKHVVSARSVKDIQQAVTEAAAAGLHVRPMGAGESWVPRLLSSDVCLVTTGLNRIHKIDRERKTIIVDGGVNLGDITRALEAHNLALPSLAFMPEATIGGIISTATHGTSHKWGTLSDFVVSLELVLASGELRRLGPDSSPDELRAARVAVGMLGVITRVELQAIDIPWVRHDNLQMDVAAFLRDLKALQTKYEHMWVHWEMGTENITIDCLEARPRRTQGFHPYIDDRERRWQQLPIPARYLSTPARRTARKILAAARVAKAKLGRPPSPQPPMLDARISMQYGFPAGDLSAAMKALKNSDVPKLFPGKDMEIKFVKGSDRSFLGPNADGDTALFNVYWRVPNDQILTALDPFESLMRCMNGRPHWGKYHAAVDVGYMQKTYAQWSKFEAVRMKFDPDGVFSVIGSSPSREGHDHSIERVALR